MATVMKLRRTITLEYTYSDDPQAQEENRWDELTESTNDEVLTMERGMSKPRWFATTEFTFVNDDIEILSRDKRPDYCGCCGGDADQAPKGEHGECCSELHDA